MRIVALYDQQLVHGEGEEELGRMLRQKFCETQEAVLQVWLRFHVFHCCGPRRRQAAASTCHSTRLATSS